MNRYSAIAVFDKDLDRVVLIENRSPLGRLARPTFRAGRLSCRTTRIVSFAQLARTSIPL